MPHLTAAADEALRDLIALVRDGLPTITHALHDRIEKFETEAAKCQAAYEAGESNALITNTGYQHMAGLFAEQARRADALLGVLEPAIDKANAALLAEVGY